MYQCLYALTTTARDGKGQCRRMFLFLVDSPVFERCAVAVSRIWRHGRFVLYSTVSCYNIVLYSIDKLMQCTGKSYINYSSS